MRFIWFNESERAEDTLGAETSREGGGVRAGSGVSNPVEPCAVFHFLLSYAEENSEVEAYGVKGNEENV